MRPLSLIGGSATLLGLCRLSSLCLRGDGINFWFWWCPEILNHSLVGFYFGLLWLLLSFHVMPLIFGCYFVQLTVYVWRRRLMAWVFWLVLWSISWSLSLAMWRWTFVFDLTYLWCFFPFILPCLGLDVYSPWCSCFIPWLDLCPWDLGLCLWEKLSYWFDDFC